MASFGSRKPPVAHPKRAFLAVYAFSPGLAMTGLPGTRETSAQKGNGDAHLMLLSEIVLPLLAYERLTVDELLNLGKSVKPVAFSNVDRDLLWRYLTWAEPRRLVSRVVLDDPHPEGWQWDLTAGAAPTFSFWALITQRLKFGALLGLAGVIAAILGADDKLVVRVIAVVLAIMTLLFWLQWRVGQWLMNWGTELVAQREDEVQQVRAEQGVAAWWPVLETAAIARSSSAAGGS